MPSRLRTSLSTIDFPEYERVLAFISSLSRLFSDSDTPILDSRVVEKAFCHLTASDDVARLDISYDAVFAQNYGVAIKTYGSNSQKPKKQSEKIAEFTTFARRGLFAGLPARQLATKVSTLRNARLSSDASELGITLEGSFYHSVVRVPGAAFVHEDPLGLIDTGSIRPISRGGAIEKSFPRGADSHVRFTDGQANYSFHRAKNVLYRTFDFGRGFTSEQFPLPIFSGIWEKLMSGELSLGGIERVIPKREVFAEADYVVLPLYSTQSTFGKTVPAKSGINQWNAGGRKRSFGEAYIPIPRKVHDLRPGFFPARDQKFKLLLPSGSVVDAKVCQQGSKALMSDPNTELCDWLFGVLDGGSARAQSRIVTRRPYTYEDLEDVGKDAVIVRRSSHAGVDFELSSAPLDSYEQWVEGTPAGLSN